MRGSCAGTTRLPEGMQWGAHTGHRQKSRNLQRNWDRFERRCMKDEYAKGTRERLLDLMVDQPHPDISCQMVALAAQTQADTLRNFKVNLEDKAAGYDMVTQLNVLINQIEANRDPQHASVPPPWLLKPKEIPER